VPKEYHVVYKSMFMQVKPQ